MSRYIDADELKKVFSDGYEAFAETLCEIVDAQPTVDVVERKQGKNISEDGFLCSVCTFGDFGGFHGYEPNFCPNCGAEMRGEEDE